jgi:hypothetical protein
MIPAVGHNFCPVSAFHIHISRTNTFHSELYFQHHAHHDNATAFFFVARLYPRRCASHPATLPSGAHSSARKAPPLAANVTCRPPFTSPVTCASRVRETLRVFCNAADTARHVDNCPRIQTRSRTGPKL